MRAGIGFAFVLIGCTSPADTEKHLPGATFTPHLDSRPADAACTDSIAFNGDATPDLVYTYSYDSNGWLSQATGVFTAGGPNDVITYSFNAFGEITHLLETNGVDFSLDTNTVDTARYEITSDYDASGALLDSTFDIASPGYTDTFVYAYSDFNAADEPTTEVVTETGQPSYTYELAYDELGRLTQATGAGETTAWTYDDTGLVVTVDTNNGEWIGTYVYDDEYRELNATTGGSDATTIATQEIYDWNGDELNTWTYLSGSTAAPTTLTTAEVDTMGYDCTSSRAPARQPGRAMRPHPARR